MKWAVQHHTLADGWVNTWTDIDDDGNETPTVYDTFAEALDALTDYWSEVEASGNEARYEKSEFRIVEVSHA